MLKPRLRVLTAEWFTDISSLPFSLGIAIIPESLIAVLTITMVVGMTQMRRRKVVVRQLSALEALGGVTNICSDKTGTLTQGQMVARKAWIPGAGVYSLHKSDDANNPTRGTITLGQPPTSKQEAEQERERKRAEQDVLRSTVGLKFDIPAEKEQRDQRRIEERNETPPEKDDPEENVLPEMIPELEAFVTSAALCNLATVRHDPESDTWQTIGDPTEVALQVFSLRFGLGKKTLETQHGWKQLAEYPFDSSVKRMSVIYRHADDPETVVFSKGAVERIIDLCTTVGVGDHQEAMTPKIKQDILEQMNFLAEQGLRVLAVAQKPGPTGFDPHSQQIPREEIEKDLTLLGLAGLYDPPRLETKDAVKGMFC